MSSNQAGVSRVDPFHAHTHTYSSWFTTPGSPLTPSRDTPCIQAVFSTSSLQLPAISGVTPAAPGASADDMVQSMDDDLIAIQVKKVIVTVVEMRERAQPLFTRSHRCNRCNRCDRCDRCNRSHPPRALRRVSLPSHPPPALTPPAGQHDLRLCVPGGDPTPALPLHEAQRHPRRRAVHARNGTQQDAIHTLALWCRADCDATMARSVLPSTRGVHYQH